MEPLATQEELVNKLAEIGWRVTSLKQTSNLWKAQGKSPTDEQGERTGQTPEMALNALLSYATRFNQIRQFAPTYAKSVSLNVPRDPNHDWEARDALGLNKLVAPVKAGTPEDYIGVAEATQNAAKIDTQWWEEDEARQRLAIMNAFRAALLSPRKHLKWNAAHYQAIMHHDPSTPAVELWHTLESARAFHNNRLGYPEDSHLTYKRELEMLADEIRAATPDISEPEARKRAKEIIFEKTKQFEEQIGKDPKYEGTSELRRYNMARRMVADWLVQNYSPGRGWMPGQTTLLGKTADYDPDEWAHLEEELKSEPKFEIGEEVVVGTQPNPVRVLVRDRRWSVYDHEWEYEVGVRGNPFGVTYPERMIRYDFTFDQPGDLFVPEDWTKESVQQTLIPTEWDQSLPDMSGFAAQDSKYGAFMGAHLDAIEKVGQHIEEIREAAMEDIYEDGGRGYLFRNRVMNMNLPGINPKVASFAWLLLAPLSSDLGIVDTHILRGLGYGSPNIPVRDYYKIERMEMAAKDASGYQHVPLGIYHWGLWDHIRNPGAHSDHSPLRVLDPQPWDDDAINWDAATTMKAGPFTGHERFEAARKVMDQVAREYDWAFMDQPKNQVPDPTKTRKREPQPPEAIMPIAPSPAMV